MAGVAVSAIQTYGQAGGGTGDGAAPGTAAPAGRGGRGGRGAGAPFVDANANLTNLAMAAKASTSYVSGDQTIDALNDGIARPGGTIHYANWPRGSQWVEYTWPVAISTNKV